MNPCVILKELACLHSLRFARQRQYSEAILAQGLHPNLRASSCRYTQRHRIIVEAFDVSAGAQGVRSGSLYMHSYAAAVKRQLLCCWNPLIGPSRGLYTTRPCQAERVLCCLCRLPRKSPSHAVNLQRGKAEREGTRIMQIFPSQLELAFARKQGS